MSYKIKAKEIPNRFGCIYKLNYPNGKIYIGRTLNLKRRMYEHNNINKAYLPCDLAIKKYGKIKEVEILEESNDEDYLKEREVFWIAYYNSNQKEIGYNLTQGGNDKLDKEGNSVRSNVKKEWVLEIRKKKFSGERKQDVYQLYKDKMTYASFDNIWKEKAFLNIGRKYFIKSKQETYYGGYKYSIEEIERIKEKVKDIRKSYKNGIAPSEIYKKYKEDFNHRQIYYILAKKTWKEIEPLDYEYLGENKFNASEKDVIKIKELWIELKNIDKISEMFKEKFSKRAIKDIISEKSWKDVKVEGFTPQQFPAKRITEEEKQQVLELYRQGFYNKAIHFKTGISEYSINKILKDNNLTPNLFVWNKRKKKSQ